MLKQIFRVLFKESFEEVASSLFFAKFKNRGQDIFNLQNKVKSRGQHIFALKTENKDLKLRLAKKGDPEFAHFLKRETISV